MLLRASTTGHGSEPLRPVRMPCTHGKLLRFRKTRFVTLCRPGRRRDSYAAMRLVARSAMCSSSAQSTKSELPSNLFDSSSSTTFAQSSLILKTERKGMDTGVHSMRLPLRTFKPAPAPLGCPFGRRQKSSGALTSFAALSREGFNLVGGPIHLLRQGVDASARYAAFRICSRLSFLSFGGAWKGGPKVSNQSAAGASVCEMRVIFQTATRPSIWRRTRSAQMSLRFKGAFYPSRPRGEAGYMNKSSNGRWRNPRPTLANVILCR